MKRLVAAAALAGFCAASSVAGPSCPAAIADARGVGRVPLFSAIPLSRTPFARRWERARRGLAEKFPGLRFEKTEDLHITLVFVSTAGWDLARLGEMERLGLDGPDLSSGPVVLGGTPDLFGPDKDVAALRLGPVPSEWSRRLMADRDAMTAAGLRPRDRYDAVFVPHASLAYARTPKDRPELKRFEAWLLKRARRFAGLKFAVGRENAPRYYLVTGRGDSTEFPPLRGKCSVGVKPAKTP